MDDLPGLWRMIYGTKNPEWKKWDAPYFPLQPEPFQYFVDSLVPALKEKPPRYLAIEIGGELKGTVSYYWESRPTRWLFENVDVPRIGMTTWSGNRRMMRCAEKAGFKMEGRIRKVRYYDGVYYDSIRYGILREEWELICRGS